jgi:hypothetical protein
MAGRAEELLEKFSTSRANVSRVYELFLYQLEIEMFDSEFEGSFGKTLDCILDRMQDCYLQLSKIFDYDERVNQIGEELDFEEQHINKIRQEMTLALDKAEGLEEVLAPSEKVAPPVQDIVLPQVDSSLGGFKEIEIVESFSDLLMDVDRQEESMELSSNVEVSTVSEIELGQTDGHGWSAIDKGILELGNTCNNMEAVQHLLDLERSSLEEMSGKIVGVEFPLELKFFVCQHNPKPGGLETDLLVIRDASSLA